MKLCFGLPLPPSLSLRRSLQSGLMSGPGAAPLLAVENVYRCVYRCGGSVEEGRIQWHSPRRVVLGADAQKGNSFFYGSGRQRNHDDEGGGGGGGSAKGWTKTNDFAREASKEGCAK